MWVGGEGEGGMGEWRIRTSKGPSLIRGGARRRMSSQQERRCSEAALTECHIPHIALTIG